MKAIIIGAGIGGLTTGIALQQIGVDVDIYEREHQLKKVGAGLALWANALNALEQLGIGDTVHRRGMATHVAGIRSNTGDALMVGDIKQLKNITDKPTVVIHRAELQDILLGAFEGDIHYAKQLSGYKQSDKCISVTFADGTSAQADILIGCDGIHSAVRTQMFPDAKPVYAGYTAYRGIIEFDHTQVESMWGEGWGFGKRFGILPVNQHQVYWYATLNADEGYVVPLENRQQLLLQQFEGWYTPVEDLLKATLPTSILQHDAYDIAPLQSWSDGRVILSGDAAHAMTPNLGQGACQAIEDAVVLSKSIQQTDSIENAIALFEARRIPRANAILKQSRTIGRMGQLSNPVSGHLRNMAFRLTPAFIRNKQLANVIGYQV